MELYAGYGKNIVTALATINGSSRWYPGHREGRPVPQVHRQGCPLRSSVRCLQHPRCDHRQHRGLRQERGRRSRQAASVRLPVWPVSTPRLPPSRSPFWPVRPSALPTPSLPPVLTGVLPCRVHRSPAGSLRPLSPFCTRTRSSLLITSSTPPRPRPPPTPRTFAAPMPLLPTVLLTPLPMLPPPAALSLRLWICWPASALCVWLRSTAISRCNHQP